MKKLLSLFAVTGLFISSAAFAGDAEIRAEMASLAVAQEKNVRDGIKKGTAVDASQNLLITAEQAENLFGSLEISSGVSSGEERGGYVVCSRAGISMGNVDISRCRIEKRQPEFMNLKSKSSSKKSIRRHKR